MRHKTFLIALLTLLLGLLSYIHSHLFDGSFLVRHTAAMMTVPDAPISAAQQQAAIQAINTLLLSGNELTTTISLTTTPPAPTPTTLVLLYINADNNLAPYIPPLVQKVQRGAANPNITTIMVLDWPEANNSRRYIVDKQGATTCDFAQEYTCGGRYVLGKNVENFYEDLGNPATLSKFITGAMRQHPEASKVVLSLVGHGGGWSPNLLAGQPQSHIGKPITETGGLLWDNYTGPPYEGQRRLGNSLSTFDLQQALRWSVNETGRKIDLLYLDACLMGMWEVAHQVRNEVNLLLASESWSWTSFAYDDHLRQITKTSTARQIGAAWLQNEAALLRDLQYPFTYSLVDLTQLPAVTASISTMAQVLTSTVTTSDEGRAKLKTAFAASACFDSSGDSLINITDTSKGKLDNYCDLKSFAMQLQQQFSTSTEMVNAAQSVQSVLASAVITEAHGCGAPGNYSSIPWCWQQLGGLSIYVPLGEEDWKRYFYGQLQVAKETGWDAFLNHYWGALPQFVIPACTEPCLLPSGALEVKYRVYLPKVMR